MSLLGGLGVLWGGLGTIFGQFMVNFWSFLELLGDIFGKIWHNFVLTVALEYSRGARVFF